MHRSSILRGCTKPHRDVAQIQIQMQIQLIQQVSLDVTPSKCMPPPLQVNWSGHDLDPCSVITKTFSTILSFIEIPHHVHRYRVTDNRRTDGRPENIMPPPRIVGGGIEKTFVVRCLQRERIPKSVSSKYAVIVLSDRSLRHMSYKTVLSYVIIVLSDSLVPAGFEPGRFTC